MSQEENTQRVSTLFFCLVPKLVKRNATKVIHMNKEPQSITSFGCLLFQSVDLRDNKRNTRVHKNIRITVTRWKTRYYLEYEKQWNNAKGNNHKRSYNESNARVADGKVKHTPSKNGNTEAISHHIKSCKPSFSHYKREDITDWQYLLSELSFQKIYSNFLQNMNSKNCLEHTLQHFPIIKYWILKAKARPI